MTVILVILAVAVLLYFFIKLFKVPKLGDLVLVTGGVKCGKSTLAVHFVMKRYRQLLRRWRIERFLYIITFKKIKKFNTEKPLLYSNIPLNCDYVPLTEDLLLRQKRFAYRSVIYCGEVSLVANSQMIKNMTVNERLMLFNKLIGHELKGGCIVYDTQSLSDCHYAIKRCVSNYYYIHHLVKWIPFLLVAYVRECRYSDDSSTLSIDTSDIEDTQMRLVFLKSTWRKFDTYCYSVFTDNLPVASDIIDGKSLPDLKCRHVVTFKPIGYESLNMEDKK